MGPFLKIETNKKKNGISEGCFSAIASKAGLSIEKIHNEDDYGVDYHIKKLYRINRKISAGNIILDVQLKGTQNWTIQNGDIKYPLRVKTFNDIVKRNIADTTRILLVVMLLHQKERSWCNVGNGNITFQNSLFYTEISDKRYNHSKPNSTTTISIPITQVLTHAKLLDLVLKYDI